MGRQERLRRMRAGEPPKREGGGMAPDPVHYWRERAKYFEQVVVAIVKAAPGQEVVLEDADIRGYTFDTQPTATGGVKLVLMKKVEPSQVVAPNGEKVLIVPKEDGFCKGGEEGPICNGAEGPHVHPPGFTGTPIRAPQPDDEPGLEGSGVGSPIHDNDDQEED